MVRLGSPTRAALIRFREAATAQVNQLNDISGNVHIAGIQYTSTDEEQAHSLATRMVASTVPVDSSPANGAVAQTGNAHTSQECWAEEAGLAKLMARSASTTPLRIKGLRRMTSWIALAAGTALAGLIIGRSAMTLSRSGSGSGSGSDRDIGEQRKHQGRAVQGWMLLTFGIVNAIAAGITTQSRVLEIAIAAVSIPLAIAILIKNRRSNAGDEKQMGGTFSSQ